MNKAQRIVLVVYWLLLAYCCLWIPWHVPRSSRYSTTYVRSGYGWLWTGPKNYCPPVPADYHRIDPCNLDDGKPTYDGTATPDHELMALQIAAVSVFGVAAFLIAGKWKAL